MTEVKPRKLVWCNVGGTACVATFVGDTRVVLCTKPSANATRLVPTIDLPDGNCASPRQKGDRDACQVFVVDDEFADDPDIDLPIDWTSMPGVTIV